MIVQRISDAHINAPGFPGLPPPGAGRRSRRVVGNAFAQNIRASAMRNDFGRTGEQKRIKEQSKP